MNEEEKNRAKIRAPQRKTTVSFKLKMSKGFDAASKLMDESRWDEENQNKKE